MLGAGVAVIYSIQSCNVTTRVLGGQTKKRAW